MRRKTLIGCKFGTLTVVEHEQKAKNEYYLLCLCECGKTKRIKSTNIYKSKSCGHLRHTANGYSRLYFRGELPEYGVWQGMRTRCLNANSPAFKHYGARGIKICDRWLVFDNFYNDMGKRPSDKHSIDRINVNGDYEPDNCRWATASQQALNKRIHL